MGAGSIIPTPLRFSSGILIESSKAGKILLDIGPGTIEKLRKLGVNPNEIETVLVTHLHIDHVVDLLPLIKLRAYASDKRRLKIYGPKGIKEWLSLLITDQRLFGYLSRLGCPDLIDVHEKHSGSSLLNPDVKVSSTPVQHFGGIAYKLELDGRTITYSGDTPRDPKLIEFARGSTVLIHECSFPREKLFGKHTSDEDLIRIVSEVEPEILIVVHLYPEMEEREESLKRRLKDAFHGEVYIPRDLDIIEV